MKRACNFSNSVKLYWLFTIITIIPFVFALGFEKQREEDFVFVLINSGILLIPLFWIRKFKLYISVVSVLLFFPALFDLVHIFLYQGRITPSIFFIIFDTNPAETSEYIESNFSLGLLFLCVTYALCIFSFLFHLLKKPQINLVSNKKKYIFFVLILPFVVKMLTSGFDIDKTLEAYRRSSHMYSMFYHYVRYRDQMNAFKSYTDNQKNKLDVVRAFETPKKELHVLIIGESTASTHMSLYGYHRNTTPFLDSIKDELYVFEDVMCSAPPGTMANLKKIVTLANTQDESNEKLSVNILNIAKSAGFKTYWISNQLILGRHDTITSVFARQADKNVFTNTTNSKSYDEKVLPFVEKYLEEDEDKKFVVIHLLGSHMVYRSRYPENYDLFKETTDIPKRPFHNAKKLQIINEYDNSIAYHDYILKEIFERIKKQNIYTTITYLSDHGEEVYDLQDLHGHPGRNASVNAFKIPTFIWKSNDVKVPINESFLKRKYVSDDIIHTISQLVGLEYKDFDATKSMLSKTFIFKERSMKRKD